MAYAERYYSVAKINAKRGSRAVRAAEILLTLLFGLTAAINFFMFVVWTSPFQMTHLVAAVLAVYILLEARLYLRDSDAVGILSPALLALVYHFFLAYLLGVTAAAFEPWILNKFGLWLPDLDAALSETLVLAGLAVFFMLRGYGLGMRAGRRLGRMFSRTNHIRRTLRCDMGLMLAIQFMFLALVFYSVSVGAFGLLSTMETRAQNANIQQFLNLGLAAGTLSYFLILLRYFERREARHAATLMGALVLLLIAMHVVIGALSAFKSQIVFPFIIAGFAYFLATKRLPVRFIGLASIALIVSYMVVEPFRAYLSERGKPPSSISEALVSLGTVLENRDQFTHYTEISRFEAISSRFDLSGVTSLAIEYVDDGQLQPEFRVEFQNSILLSPILAYVPRFIWQEKPSYSTGVWFHQNVMGMQADETTSVGMGPIGYLYMTGGILGIIAGFLAFGVLQALIFESVGRLGAGGIIIYLSVASTIAGIPSDFGPSVTGVLRMLPIAFFAQWFLLKQAKRVE